MAATPRYKELAEALRADVLAGSFVESGFPTESELCQRFGVSRFTVREALRALTADGLITRKRGSGTVIQPATARGGALHQPLSNVAEIMQYARNTRTTFELVGDAPLPRGIAQQLDLVAGGRWTKFKGLRTTAGSSEPIATTDAYVHESLRAHVEKIAPNEDTIFKQLEKLAGIKIASVTQDIQAVPATTEVATALGVAKRSPCLLILRCYRNAAGEILEISANHHPGDRFAYAMHIEVEG